MPNWYGAARSNYVKVNPKKLAVLLELFPGVLHSYKENKACLLDYTGEGAPTIGIENEDQKALLEELGVENPDNLEDFNLLDLVHHILIDEPDNVLVWVETGAEKLRYVTGFSVAIAPDGTVLKQVNLSDIYTNTNWSRAEY